MGFAHLRLFSIATSSVYVFLMSKLTNSGLLEIKLANRVEMYSDKCTTRMPDIFLC